MNDFCYIPSLVVGAHTHNIKFKSIPKIWAHIVQTLFLGIQNKPLWGGFMMPSIWKSCVQPISLLPIVCYDDWAIGLFFIRSVFFFFWVVVVNFLHFLLRYMYKLLKKQMHGIELTSNLHPILNLKKEELVWLGLSAYVRVLRKKQSRYSKLLSLLSSNLQKYGRMESTSVDLKYAVDDSHSSLIWKIKY